MFLKKSLVWMAATALLVLPGRCVFADDLQRVLQELDAAAAKFHSTSADFEADTVMTEPVPDKDVMKGTAYYERKGPAFSMAAHIAEFNGKPDGRIYTFSDGQFKLDNALENHVTTFTRAGAFESYIMLGFGASGKELSEKWDIKYDGPETINGVKTEKLELVAKDPTVRQNLPKVTVWLDTTRAVSIKQVFDQGQGTTRTCVYSNIKVNQPPLPKDAFRLKTDSKTTYSTQ
jgi:outer membrane lipoprotein-sorting protein